MIPFKNAFSVPIIYLGRHLSIYSYFSRLHKNAPILALCAYQWINLEPRYENQLMQISWHTAYDQIWNKNLQKWYHRRPDASPSSDNRMGPLRGVQLLAWKAARGAGVYQRQAEGDLAPSLTEYQHRLPFVQLRSCFNVDLQKRKKRKMMHVPQVGTRYR